MKQNKYSKLQSPTIPPLAYDNIPLVLHFASVDGRPQKIDLTFFTEGEYSRPKIAKACAEVFWLDTQAYSYDSRVNFKNNLRVFNNFLNWRAKNDIEKQIITTLEINSSLFFEYQAYLAVTAGDQTKETTAASKYHVVTRFFARMQAMSPQYLPKDLKIPANPFSLRSSQQTTEHSIIGLKDLKLIADAAVREVIEIREDHRRAFCLLESATPFDEQARMKNKPRGFWNSIANLLYYFVRVEGIRFTSTKIYSKLRYHSHPTPKKVLGWYAPTSEEYFIPFLVLLYIRTAINVTSIFKLSRDCLAEHPLPLGLTICKFTKPRSGSRSNKELSFPTNQPNGAIDLIRFLLEYTQPWVEHASKAEKDALFLYRCSGVGVRSAGRCFTQRSVARFIKRNKLPHFSLDQLRPSIATMLYLQTRDIFRVQRLLDHSSIRTTIKYIKGAVVHAQHNKEMSEGIDQMVEAVTGIKYPKNAISVFTEPIVGVVAAKVKAGTLSPEAGEKVLKGGHKTLMSTCKDPLDSPQPGEKKGRVCRSLHSCLSCENCWVFAEDLPETIKYRNDLEAEKADMTSEMWEQLNGDAVREINESILACFPAEVIEQAEVQTERMQSSDSINELESN